MSSPAGRLSEIVTILAPVETPDGQGGASVAWSEVATVRAQLVPMRAVERLQAEAIGAVSDYRFRIYVRADVRPTMRVSWTPRWPQGQAPQELEIAGTLLEANRRTMLLDCGVRA